MECVSGIADSAIEILAVFGAPALLRKVAVSAGSAHDLTPSEPTYYRIRALELRELEEESRVSPEASGRARCRTWASLISTDGLPKGADGAVIAPEVGDRIVLGRGKVIGYDGETEFFGPAREVHVVAPLDPAERVAAVHRTAVRRPALQTATVELHHHLRHNPEGWPQRAYQEVGAYEGVSF